MSPLANFMSKVGFQFDMASFDSQLKTVQNKLKTFAREAGSGETRFKLIPVMQKKQVTDLIKSFEPVVLRLTPSVKRAEISALLRGMDDFQVRLRVKPDLVMLRRSLRDAELHFRVKAKLINIADLRAALRNVNPPTIKILPKFNLSDLRAALAAIPIQTVYVRLRTIGGNNPLNINQNQNGGGGSGGGGGSDSFMTRAMKYMGLYFGLGAASKFGQQAFDVGNFQTSQMPQYEFLTGSTEGAQEQIKYVDNLVDKLKLNLQDTNLQYTQFLGATKSSIGVEKTQETFETLQTFGVMMGATGDSLKRGTKAVQQMLSKQKLSAEELDYRLAA